MLWQKLIAGGMFVASGMVVYVLLLNRLVLHMRDRHVKRAIVLTGFAGTVLIGFASGFMTGFSAWLAIPIALLACALTAQVLLTVTQRKHRADPPVEEQKPEFSLFRPFTTRDLAITRYELPLPQLPVDRLRIVHISDLHVSRGLPQEYYLSAMERVTELEPDLLFITGDFITKIKYAGRLKEILSGAKGKLGTFAILGNHDYWAGAAEVAAAVSAAGVELLHNEYRRIQIADNFSLTLSGCEDPWGPDEWTPPPQSPDSPLLVLVHTADNIYKLGRAGAFAVFAGHYHGGQGTIPWLGTVIIPSRYGRRFDYGHFLVDNTHLFVTSGLGAAAPPLRVYCHPEILAVDLIGSIRIGGEIRTRQMPSALLRQPYPHAQELGRRRDVIVGVSHAGPAAWRLHEANP